MKKKLLVTAGIIILILLFGYFYLDHRNRTLSPPGVAKYIKGDFSIEIPYSRPSKKGRVIFGTEEEGALQPNGVYWRLGANESTEVTFSKDVLFNGEPIGAGTYRMYAVPGPESFEVSLNTELGKWGAFEPDYSLDVLKTAIPIELSTDSVEQFTIGFDEKGETIFIVCEWSFVNIKIPVEMR